MEEAFTAVNVEVAGSNGKPDEVKEVRVRLKYRPEVMTLNDMCILEEPPNHRAIRTLLSKHFVDENGHYIEDTKAAERAVGEVPRHGIALLIQDLWRQINAARQETRDPN